jgi:hypothetical protein
MKNYKTYTQVIELPTFEERFKYLKLNGSVGLETFGLERFLNQQLYKSREWKYIRNSVIIRDNACDLGCKEREISNYAFVHHLNPITADDILENRSNIFDMNNLICVSRETHNALHYGVKDVILIPLERKPGDTKLW